MTNSTFLVLIVMSLLVLAGIRWLVRALRSVKAGRPGAQPAAVGAGLFTLAWPGPVLWQISHYVDLRDGTRDSIVPSAPIFQLSFALLVAAVVLGAAALIRRLSARRSATFQAR